MDGLVCLLCFSVSPTKLVVMKNSEFFFKANETVSDSGRGQVPTSHASTDLFPARLPKCRADAKLWEFALASFAVTSSKRSCRPPFQKFQARHAKSRSELVHICSEGTLQLSCKSHPRPFRNTVRARVASKFELGVWDRSTIVGSFFADGCTSWNMYISRAACQFGVACECSRHQSLSGPPHDVMCNVLVCYLH